MPSAAHVRETLARATSQRWAVLLTFEHADLAESVRLTSNPEVTTSHGSTFLPFPFRLSRPDELEEGTGRGRIVVDNVDRRIMVALRSIETEPTVTIETVRVDDPDVDEHPMPALTVLDVDIGVFDVTLDIGYPDDDDAPASNRRFTPSRAPGLW
jgi:hypothetical protein